jgi:hypothetical protein
MSHMLFDQYKEKHDEKGKMSEKKIKSLYL